MLNTDLYAQILGLKAPWFVENVDLKVCIWRNHEAGTLWACPDCGKLLPCRDHVAERVW